MRVTGNCQTAVKHATKQIPNLVMQKDLGAFVDEVQCAFEAQQGTEL
jgi:hypothetical protein